MARNRNRVRRGRGSTTVCRSNGPDVLIRGSAKQIADKYEELAREAEEVDRELLLQHAEHWTRRFMEARSGQSNRQQRLPSKDNPAQHPAARQSIQSETHETPGS